MGGWRRAARAGERRGCQNHCQLADCSADCRTFASRTARTAPTADDVRPRGRREMVLGNGEPAFAAVRALKNPTGLLAVIQARDDALANWRSITALTGTLSATTAFVVLILGFAFHWQATRAREADLINDTVRSRVDTALNRGRCGLWDWDLARGRVF